ncbi:MAG: dodecin domain-containing protein [Candidatus Lokiarchaeota archaeon]|nr:dodecin domain-containing protein [Candidatus Lokiarchaeota archaeon]
MPDSIYKVIELVGSSEKGWEDAVQKIIAKAGETLRDLRIAEVVQLDVKIDNNKVILYRARIKVSFKYEGK